ncbi:arabinogalactan endo-beta-1,4-galactanase [Cytophagales bacterium WSM2-2]|nr:arabinogalactan endo-beta-1,4-galactanase [Cytophagales bacterium WSM2-2]
MNRVAYWFLLVIVAVTQCGDKSGGVTPPETTIFAKGADVGWLTQMEAAGVKFYNKDGVQQECMQILKDLGINSIRLRAWVHPTDGWNNTKDLVIKAKRAKSLGMRIMIDFHYSDDWADPGKQYKPVSWASLSFDALKTTLYDYTKSVMDTLQSNDITPEWVQIGNETNDGMLWEDGRASKSMSNFAALINAGYNAVKAVSKTTKVIVHISNGHDNSLFRWMFDGLTKNNANYDIIGMSLYPSYASQGVNGWSAVNSLCLTNMNDMVTRYNKPVMVVEVGMPVNDAATAKAFLVDIINKTKAVPGKNGLGVFYWEPECYKDWQGYKLGAFDDSGKPSIALEAFSN